jgi:hypothetical protein
MGTTVYFSRGVVIYIGVLITMPIYASHYDLFVSVTGIVTVKLYASLLRF